MRGLLGRGLSGNVLFVSVVSNFISHSAGDSFTSNNSYNRKNKSDKYVRGLSIWHVRSGLE